MEVTNRVKFDLIAWNEREKEQAQIPGGNIYDPRFLKEKLAHLDVIAARYKSTLSADEKLTLIHVNRMREDIVKKHLNLFQRIVRKLTGKRRDDAIEQREVQGKSQQVESLSAGLKPMGFSNMKKELARQIDRGEPSFEIPVSFYRSAEERMDYTLQFSRNRNGEYEIEGYTAKLTNERLHTSSPEVIFKPVNGLHFSSRQAYSLLAGRSVALEHQDPINVFEKASTIWYKLNLDIGANSARLKEFREDYGFIPEVTLRELDLRYKNQDVMESIYPQLMQGDRVPVEVMNGPNDWKRIFLEIDPQENGFKFFNDFLSPISKWEALNINAPGQPMLAADKAVLIEPKQILTNAVSLEKLVPGTIEAVVKEKRGEAKKEEQTPVKTRSGKKKIVNRMRGV